MRYILIGGIIGAVLILGGSIYYFYYLNDAQKPGLSSKSVVPTPSPKVSTNSAAVVKFSDEYLNTLTDEERQILAIDRQIEGELKRNRDLITRNAKDASELDISKCEPKPVVFKATVGKSFRVKNSDSVPHRIATGVFREKIPANSDKIIEFASDDQQNKVGVIRGYSCDNTRNGFILMVMADE